MLCRATVGFCVLLTISFLSNSVARAQSPSSDDTPPPVFDTTKSMDPPQPGDHWTYEVRDFITGVLKNTITYTITDVTPTEIGVRQESLGSANVANSVFDYGWNIVNMPPWKYSPNDGLGVKLPLAPGKTWNFSVEATNVMNSVTFHRSGTSKVVGKDSVVTGAGIFDAYKVEISSSVDNMKVPTNKAGQDLTIWYVPSVARWVKVIAKTTANGHVTQNTSVELMNFGRRE